MSPDRSTPLCELRGRRRRRQDHPGAPVRRLAARAWARGGRAARARRHRRRRARAHPRAARSRGGHRCTRRGAAVSPPREPRPSTRSSRRRSRGERTWWPTASSTARSPTRAQPARSGSRPCAPSTTSRSPGCSRTARSCSSSRPATPASGARACRTTGSRPRPPTSTSSSRRATASSLAAEPERIVRVAADGDPELVAERVREALGGD